MEAREIAATIFGSMQTILGLVLVLYGMPRQIMKNRDEKHCGQTLSVINLTMGVLICRSIYAYLTRAWLLIPSDIVGLTLWFIILRQHGKYQKRVKSVQG